jgi:hypothetical protein
VSIRLSAEVDTNDVAESIVNDYEMTRDNYRGLLQFVVDIDDYVCDLQFTKALRDRLTEIIAECEAE